MRYRRRWVLILPVLALVGTLVWLVLSSRESAQVVAFSWALSPTPPPSNTLTFSVSNVGPRAILLTHVIVEGRKPGGWQIISDTPPSHPQRLAMGETKDLSVAPPITFEPWRCRVAYGTDVKGPLVWLARADYAISNLRLPRGLGIMAGSNTLCSAEFTPEAGAP